MTSLLLRLQFAVVVVPCLCLLCLAPLRPTCPIFRATLCLQVHTALLQGIRLLMFLQPAWLVCCPLLLFHRTPLFLSRLGLRLRVFHTVKLFLVLENLRLSNYRPFLRGCNNPHLPPIKGLTCARWSQHRYRLSQTYLAHLSTARAQLLLQDVAFTTI